MAIEIQITSDWDTDDGEGRRVEVRVLERAHPSEDPIEDSRFFASGDVERLKEYLCALIDAKAPLFLDGNRRECSRCARVVATPARDRDFVCDACAR